MKHRLDYRFGLENYAHFGSNRAKDMINSGGAFVYTLKRTSPGSHLKDIVTLILCHT